MFIKALKVIGTWWEKHCNCRFCVHYINTRGWYEV